MEREVVWLSEQRDSLLPNINQHDIGEIKTSLGSLRSSHAEIKETLAELRADNKAVWKRIDEQRNLVETVQNLALSVRDMAAELKQLRTEYEVVRRDMENVQTMALSLRDITGEIRQLREEHANLRHDVDEVKSRPAKRWDAVIGAAIAGIVGIGIGLLSRLMLP